MPGLPSTACSVCASIKLNRFQPALFSRRNTVPGNGIIMADEEDDDQEQDETPEPPQRIFTLTEAERARQELEPFLVEAMDSRKKLSGLDSELPAVSAPIMSICGGMVPYENRAPGRMEPTLP